MQHFKIGGKGRYSLAIILQRIGFAGRNPSTALKYRHNSWLFLSPKGRKQPFLTPSQASTLEMIAGQFHWKRFGAAVLRFEFQPSPAFSSVGCCLPENLRIPEIRWNDLVVDHIQKNQDFCVNPFDVLIHFYLITRKIFQPLNRCCILKELDGFRLDKGFKCFRSGLGFGRRLAFASSSHSAE